jgi:hypothetical protein
MAARQPVGRARRASASTRWGGTRVQKHNKQIQNNPSGSSQKMGLFSLHFFPPSLGCFAPFFYRVFGRFVTRGVKKRDKKIAEIFPQPPKNNTYLYLLTSLFCFYGAPWRYRAFI